jgi:hypothetical protein
MLAVEVDWNLFGRYQDVMTPGTLVGVVIAAGVSIWVVMRLRAWFREDAGRADDKLEMLTQFRDLHQQGELTEDEYRLIKSRLAREAVASPVATPTGKQKSANAADGNVRQVGGTEKAGETGRNGAGCEESRSLTEPPNLNSAS